MYSIHDDNGGVNGGAAVPEAERFVAAFDSLFPQDQVRFYMWAYESWYGTVGMLRHLFETSPDGFCIHGPEFVGGLMRAGYRLDPRDWQGREIEDPRRALVEGEWSSGPRGT